MRSASSGSSIRSLERGAERIAKLTPSQEGQIPAFVDKWNRIATSTEPFDIDSAIEGIERFAESFGAKSFGDQFYETDSPAVGWHDSAIDHTKEFPDDPCGHAYKAFYELERSG
jgi:hypothetical protein